MPTGYAQVIHRLLEKAVDSGFVPAVFNPLESFFGVRKSGAM
jgi:hypothetical protein